MAIGRISGSVLKSNLTRNGVDLAFETNLLYLDVTNSRVGIGTSEPTTALQVTGTVTATAFAGDGSQLTGINVDTNIQLVGDDSTGATLGTGETFKIAGATGITTAVSGDTLTVTGPDLSSYITATSTDTLTNKTIDSASNTLTLDLGEGTLTGTTAEFNTALQDGSFATLAGTETLTNKTLTSPNINEAVALTATATELNYLDGVTGITLGTANELLIVGSDGTSIISDSTLSIDTGSNYIGINQSSPEVTLHMTGEGAQTAQVRMEQYNDSADAPDLRTRRYRGTIASPLAVNSGDYLYRSNHEYWNGSALIVGGTFAFDNTNNANRTQFAVSVTTDGTSADANTPSKTQFKIDGNDSGAITFNNAYKFPTTDGSANQYLKTDGSGNVSWSTVVASTGDITFTGSTISSPSNSDITITNSGTGAVNVDSNKIINLGTPTADTDAANKKYVDDSVAAVSTTSIAQLNSSVAVTDSGSNGTITVSADGNTELVINDTSATFSGNVVVTGDLTVNGTTTTVATTNTVVSDSLMELGNGTTGAPANDAGLVIERGDSNNAFIGFDESEDKFKIGTGTFTGASTGNLTITTGTLVANLEGNVTGAVTGNASTATALETARAIQVSGAVTGTANFDGSAAINIVTTNTADPTITLGGDLSGAVTLTNLASGTLTATVGTLNQNTTGSAATLTTARTIGGVSFNGSANINLPGVNTTGNQNTSGNAATATTATNVTASANNTTNETVYITFVDGATGAQGIETDTGLTYNPSTGLLSTAALSISGNITVTGTVDGRDVATDGTKLDGIESGATADQTASEILTAIKTVDGAASGLDADLLDGVQGSSYATLTGSQTLTNKTLTSPQINTQIDVLAQGQVRLQDTAGGQYIALRAPGTVTSNTILTLPDGAGTSGQVLSTDGAGVLSWADGGGGGSGASYPNSTISTMPGSDGNYDLGKNAAQDTAETPFETGGTDAFGVNLGTVFDMMDPIGTTETTDLGADEAYVGA